MVLELHSPAVPTFTQDDRIFRDENVLQDDYTPKDLPAREDELEAYTNSLQPVVNGASPRNIFVYGETGTGKTVATNRIIDDLNRDQKNFEDVEIKFVKINCKDLTSYQAGVHLVNEFREPSNHINSTGHSRADVNNKLWTHLEEIDATHVLFVLDEIDSLSEDDDLLYQIPRANANAKVEGTKVGLIGISNNFTFRQNLSARVQSSLCEDEIHFAPYDANQLTAILKQRSEKAFSDGVLEEGVVPLTAGLVAQDTGSARNALDILYRAGTIARNENNDVVTENHVRQAMDAVENGLIKDEIRALPTQAQLVIYTVAVLNQSGQNQVTKKEIHRLYKKFCKRTGVNAKSQRTIHNKLSKLQLKGFLNVTEENKGRGGGKRYKYELGVDADLINDALQDTPRLRDLSTNSTISQFS
ncbi:ORC complex protein Cdc6/Orc1 (plasmid) [Natronococcus occultus SP4]|uniref:ORC1-type DNA replication protein n=1 Tax=Natronococcus occultus SP4 TaxID=694430 RepID=L0K6R4_9EURY|nr:ORC complex protein Cdc6/Orc1 [Natronococcus occultus SP4]